MEVTSLICHANRRLGRNYHPLAQYPRPCCNGEAARRELWATRAGQGTARVSILEPGLEESRVCSVVITRVAASTAAHYNISALVAGAFPFDHNTANVPSRPTLRGLCSQAEKLTDHVATVSFRPLSSRQRLRRGQPRRSQTLGCHSWSTLAYAALNGKLRLPNSRRRCSGHVRTLQCTAQTERFSRTSTLQSNKLGTWSCRPCEVVTDCGNVAALMLKRIAFEKRHTHNYRSHRSLVDRLPQHKFPNVECIVGPHLAARQTRRGMAVCTSKYNFGPLIHWSLRRFPLKASLFSRIEAEPPTKRRASCSLR